MKLQGKRKYIFSQEEKNIYTCKFKKDSDTTFNHWRKIWGRRKLVSASVWFLFIGIYAFALKLSVSCWLEGAYKKTIRLNSLLDLCIKMKLVRQVTCWCKPSLSGWLVGLLNCFPDSIAPCFQTFWCRKTQWSTTY